MISNEILSYFSKSHAQYIHARGAIGTRVLIRQLNCQPDEDILEVGFGTGSTLAQIYSNNKKANLYGLEQSPLMYKKAKARLKFSLIGNSIKLSLMKDKGQFPFPTNSFDKIYSESVLGIQEGDELVTLLNEIRRVLRPNGILVMNETIWLDTTSINEIIYINEFCKRSFGIILSNSDYPYLKSWMDLFDNLNFHCISVIKLDDFQGALKSEFRFPYNFLSTVFTAIGKTRASLSFSMRTEKKNYHQKTTQINPDNKLLMGGIIFKVVNKK